MAKTRNNNKPSMENQLNQNHSAAKLEKPPSWAVLRSLLTRAHPQPPPLLPPPPENQPQRQRKKEKLKEESRNRKKGKKMYCSGSLCSNVNTKVTHRPDPSSTEDNKKRGSMGSGSTNRDGSGSGRSMKAPLGVSSGSSFWVSSVSSTSTGGSYRGRPFRGFAGCYECRMVVDPVLGVTRSDPPIRPAICSCPYCGEIFMKPENLELHQRVRHAVSELGPEETSKNIVEIIFQSSWLTKQSPICKIDRILKVQNTPKTISKFEEYRDAIKAKAAKLPKRHPRCIADGNELLRFHCTTVACSLGLDGSSNLCHSIPTCNVCNIIKNGFKFPGGGSVPVTGKGILTTGTSGKAHENAGMKVGGGDDRRAMLVCRVIAGRVKKNLEGSMEEYDSVAGAAEFYSNVDELYVFNPMAILPCFVVIYRGF